MIQIDPWQYQWLWYFDATNQKPLDDNIIFQDRAMGIVKIADWELARLGSDQNFRRPITGLRCA